MSRIGFVLKPKQNNEARRLLSDLASWARAHGHSCFVLAEDRVNPEGATLVANDELGAAVDLCVVLGGDGTILRASALVADHNVPLLGINLGRLGFLSPYEPNTAIDTLADAVAGNLSTVERMRFSVTYRPKSGEDITRPALNDVVISQGAMARLVELTAHLDDCFVNTYRADGLVVCTPTGSTAYNLAAGGPIVYPGQHAVTITPICAQGLSNRPLVVDGKSRVRISMDGESRGVVMTIDGQWAHSFQQGDEVEIAAASTPLTVFSTDEDYFNILRAKLHWGVTPSA